MLATENDSHRFTELINDRLMCPPESDGRTCRMMMMMMMMMEEMMMMVE